MSVLALVAAGAPELQAAVRAQTRPPAAVRVAGDVVAEAAAVAREASEDWLWLLDGGAVPRPDALERLLADAPRLPRLDAPERLHDPAQRAAAPPAPALLAGMVVDAEGGVVTGMTAWYRREAAAVAVEAAGLGALPVRAAPAACLLVDRRAAAGAAPPLDGAPGIAAAIAWTAGLLRDAPGYLVTASVADARTSAAWPREALAGDPAEDLRAAFALAAVPGLSGRDRLRIAGDGTGRALAAARAGRVGAAPLLAAVAQRGRRALRARGAA
jgi:hypothetical protein